MHNHRVAMNKSETECREVGGAFQIAGDFAGAAGVGTGHIHQTCAVTYNQAGCPVRYMFQKINDSIFRDVPKLMENIRRVTAHAYAALEANHAPDPSRRTLTIVPTREGEPFLRTPSGQFWRVYYFIEGARTYERIETASQAFEAARAFGRFQALLADLPGGRLNETIPNFHHTRSRLEALRRAIAADARGRAAGVRAEIDFFLAREADADVLLALHAAERLPERVTHNDCKLNNVMLDDETGEGICVIDLDTVMPGLVHYDFGDMVRTATSTAFEDERDLSKVSFQLPMFEALARGYLAGAGHFLTADETAHLAFAGKLITMETGMRFLTDYLEGDVYFRTHREGHNLDRCRTQIALVREMERHMPAMEEIVKIANC